MIVAIKRDIETFLQNTALWDETNFECRLETLDQLEFIIDELDGLQNLSNPPSGILSLKQCAQQIKTQLESINGDLLARMRVAIRTGRYTGAALLKLINRYAGRVSAIDQPILPVVGYDNLDVFTNGLFPLQVLPIPTLEREPEMVFYQKTPARIIFELVAKANLTNQDVFYDLGSGLGHVCILVNLLTGTSARGIEVEPAYCTYAKICATDLNLSDVVFICEDARTATHSDGTVFFLHTPFKGRLLQDVLDKLQVIAGHRSIKLFTYGPCTAHIAQQNWLTCTGELTDYLYKLGEFRSCPAD